MEALQINNFNLCCFILYVSAQIKGKNERVESSRESFVELHAVFFPDAMQMQFSIISHSFTSISVGVLLLSVIRLKYER